MTTQAAELRAPAATASERIVRFISRAPVHLALVAIALIWMIPTVGLLVTSFRPKGDILGSAWWHTNSVTGHNYDVMLHRNKMLSSLVNSLIISVPSTLLPLAIGAAAAFAFSWIRFPFRDTIFLGIVALLVVPTQTAFVPVLREFQTMGDLISGRKDLLTSSYVGIWIAHTTFALPFAIFLLRNFFITLPRDLIEAARVDGASNLHIFAKVIIPLSVPALASFGIFQFLWVWNDLLHALVFIQNSDLLPMTVRISQVQSTYGVEWDLLSAGAFLLMLVPLVVFFSLQRYFVTGLLAGSVK